MMLALKASSDAREEEKDQQQQSQVYPALTPPPPTPAFSGAAKDDGSEDEILFEPVAPQLQLVPPQPIPEQEGPPYQLVLNPLYVTPSLVVPPPGSPALAKQEESLDKVPSLAPGLFGRSQQRDPNAPRLAPSNVPRYDATVDAQLSAIIQCFGSEKSLQDALNREIDAPTAQEREQNKQELQRKPGPNPLRRLLAQYLNLLERRLGQEHAQENNHSFSTPRPS